MTVGIEWIQDYHGNGNLSNTRAQAEGFANTLTAVRSFNFGDDLAWDQDFEEQGVGSPPPVPIRPGPTRSTSPFSPGTATAAGCRLGGRTGTMAHCTAPRSGSGTRG
jgi:Family of unknown function (DUF6345)